MDAQGWKFQLTEKTNEITRQKHTRGTNKIIIVGHPHSGYEHVTQLLADSGMTHALPTLREGLSPQNVNSQICSAHGIPPLDEWQIDHQDEIRQLEVSPIWHGLVLDMIRGNMNQPLWGWADPSAVFLLNFWKSVTPDITFVLVYNHPRSALNVHKTENADDIREEYQSPERALEYWRKYNEALLQFYQQNNSECLLVHAEQLQKSPLGMLNGIKAATGSELIPSYDDSDPPNGHHNSGFTLNHSSIPPEPINLSRFAKRKAHTSIIHQDAAENPLEVFLAEKLLDHYPDAKDLYEELQAVATVPFHKKTSVEVGINMVWHAFQDLLNTNAQLSTENHSFKAKLDALSQEYDNVQNALEAKQLVNERLFRESEELQDELKRHKDKSDHLQNRIIELEQIEQRSVTEAKELKLLRAQFTDLTHEKKEKEAQLSSIISQKQNIEKEQELNHSRSLIQLQRIQSEIEEYYLENKRKTVEITTQKAARVSLQKEKDEFALRCKKLETELKRVQQENSLRANEIKTLISNQKPVFIGAKERQQNELVYQIGCTIIGLSRSFLKWKLLLYPLFIARFLKSFSSNAPAVAESWLPPLSQYQDYDEAIKAQSHLSYQLGVTWQKNCHRFGAYLVTAKSLLRTYSVWKKDNRRKSQS
jgi:hypothetical protein